MKHHLLLIFLSLFHPLFSDAQGVAVNGSGLPADSSAILDVSSSNQGMLIPRMTELQRNQIQQPAEALLIYNTTTGCINFFRAGAWIEVCGNCITPPAPAVGSNGPVCSGDTVFLYASYIPNASYSWTGPNGFTASVQNPVIPNADALFSGTFSCTVTVYNCPSPAASTLVTVNPLPSSSFTSSPVSPAYNQACTFTPTLSGAQYNWTFQSGSPATSTAQNPSVIWTAPGSYNVTLNISQNGCTSSSTATVVVQNCSSYGQSQTFNYTGSMQNWTVPSGVCLISIEARGAQGGNGDAGSGGLGARMKGDFSVSPGQVISILVGQQGLNNPTSSSYYLGKSTGGGGGSFVTSNGQLLIAAGGGGGGGEISGGLDASITNDGVAGSGPGGNSGGTAGNGGAADGGMNSGRGGGGYYTNGGTPGGDSAVGGPGFSFLNGGAGGSNGAHAGGGGYGGGGGGGNYGGGGGGGYSGGGGGSSNGYGGGGGGSFNSGSNQTNTAGFQSGNGQVIISW